MSYASLLALESTNAQMLAVIKPYIIHDTWTVESGSVYVASSTYPTVISVTENGTSLTEAASSVLSAGEWYYEPESQLVYIRTSTSAAPSNFTIVLQFEVYFGTYDAHWHRVPTDNTTATVYYEPLIMQSPEINQGGADTVGGFLPTKASVLKLSNATHYFETLLYDVSFHKAPIDLYHWLDDSGQDELSTSNIKKVFTGYCGSIAMTGIDVDIQVLDSTDVFLEEWRNPTGSSFFSTTTFASLDVNQIGKPIKYVYGMVDGLVPTNIDSVKTNPTTSDNREWVACHGTKASMGSVSTTVTGASSTTTRTYVVTTNGLNVGDSVKMHHIGPGHEHYVTITAINRTSHYFDHEAIHSAMNASDPVTRECIGNVIIVQNGQAYRAQYDRDYTVTNFSGTTVGFTFSSSLESNLSMPATLSANDRVICRVYGKENDVTLSGSPLGSDDTQTNCLTDPGVILFDILKRILSESEIDLPSISALVTSRSDALGFSIPKSSSSNFPTYKDLIIDISQTCLLRIFPDNDLKWSVSEVGPLTTATEEVLEDQILQGSFRYTFDYNEIVSDIIVTYNRYELSDEASASGEKFTQVTYQNDVATYLHRVSRQKTVNSLYFKQDDAVDLSRRLAFMLSDRVGTLFLATKNNAFGAEVGEVAEVSRPSLPGFSWVQDTQTSRDLVIVALDKSLKNVKMTLNDQKGIEDNSGDW